MPFSMYIAANNSFTAICLALWIRLSKDLRKQPGFWKRFLWFFVTRACNLLTVWFYALFGTSFTRIPTKYQWILALFSPIPREIFTRMFKYLSFKMGLLSNNLWIWIIQLDSIGFSNHSRWNCCQIHLLLHSYRWSKARCFLGDNSWRSCNASKYLYHYCDWFWFEHLRMYQDCQKV